MINKHPFILILLTVFFLISSCDNKLNSTELGKNEKLSKTELANWESKHLSELYKSRDLKDYKFDVKYLPSASDGQENFSLVMRIQNTNNSNVFHASQKYTTDDSKMMYWTSQVKNLLKLESDKDTVNSDIVVFENTGNLRNDLIINIGFTGNFKDSKWMKLSYNDEYLGLGIINFDLTETILNAPKLEF